MSRTVLRTSASTSTQALVVTSPATMTTPVLTRVSQATRPRGSAARIASSTASEIWSATLSGCPSDTDSEVNEKLLLIMSNPFRYLAKILAVAPQELGARECVILRPARFDLDRPQQARPSGRSFPSQDRAAARGLNQRDRHLRNRSGRPPPAAWRRESAQARPPA